MKYGGSNYITNTKRQNIEILTQLKGLWRLYKRNKDPEIYRQIQDYGDLLKANGYKKSKKPYGRSNNRYANIRTK